MDFSKENQLSFADADKLFRDLLHQAAYRYAHYRTSQTQKPLNEKLSFCQIPHRREKVLPLFRQRNHEKTIRCSRMKYPIDQSGHLPIKLTPHKGVLFLV
jgi:hypothetical protein